MAKANHFARFMEDESAQTSPVRDIAVGTILIVIAFVIALALFPTLTASVSEAQGDANLSSSASTMIGLIPLVLAAALTLGGVSFLVSGIRRFRS